MEEGATSLTASRSDDGPVEEVNEPKPSPIAGVAAEGAAVEELDAVALARN
jgi:hypothetical protein